MRFKNTSRFDDAFLRHAVEWCREFVELPASALIEARFGRRSRVGGFNGRCWYICQRSRILVGVPDKPGSYPREGYKYPGRKSEIYRGPDYPDEIANLICIITHELWHARENYRATESGEVGTMAAERRVAVEFAAKRSELLPTWGEPYRTKGNRSAAKRARADVSLWDLSELDFTELKRAVLAIIDEDDVDEFLFGERWDDDDDGVPHDSIPGLAAFLDARHEQRVDLWGEARSAAVRKLRVCLIRLGLYRPCEGDTLSKAFTLDGIAYEYDHNAMKRLEGKG